MEFSLFSSDLLEWNKFMHRRLDLEQKLKVSSWFKIMGIANRGGNCSKAIYLNLSELNIKFLIKHSRSVAWDQETTGKPFQKPPRDMKTSTNSSVRHCLQQRTYWLEWYLVIARKSPGSCLCSLVSLILTPFVQTKWLAQIFIDWNTFNKINKVRLEWTSIVQNKRHKDKTKTTLTGKTW